jgi:Fe2+ or Zn2+ uptake regulation protein
VDTPDDSPRRQDTGAPGAGTGPGAGDRPPSFRERARRALRSGTTRWTQQRDVLLDVIEHTPGHLDADELYRLARDRDPRISLSTVYRTLGLLKRHDLVDELHLGEEHHHYEARTGDPADQHFHFVCTFCSEVQELSGGAVAHLRDALEREYGVVVRALDLDVVGLCARCAAAHARTSSQAATP